MTMSQSQEESSLTMTRRRAVRYKMASASENMKELTTRLTATITSAQEFWSANGTSGMMSTMTATSPAKIMYVHLTATVTALAMISTTTALITTMTTKL
jgi:hypothetical protein